MFRDDNVLQFSFRNMMNTFIVSPIPNVVFRANGLQDNLLLGRADGKDKKNF